MPAWKTPFNAVRIAAGLLGVLLVAVAVDIRLRLGLLLWKRKTEACRIRNINKLVHVWGASTFWVARVALGLNVVVEGRLPSSGRYLVLSNHQSSLDIPLMISVFRALNLKFVALEEWFSRKPAVSLGLRHGGFGVISKRGLGKDLAALKRFGRQVERFDGSPLIFPEGRRTDDGFLLPFGLAGAEVVRRTSRLPLLPVTIDGLWRARTIRDVRLLAGATITVRISEPVPFEVVEQDRRRAYGAIEETIRRNLNEIRGSAKSRRSAGAEG